MFRTLMICTAVIGALAAPSEAAAKLRVAASINDLASIAASVGGPEVEVFSIARATANAHRVEVLPSYMVKVSRAQLYLKVGLGLDRWADGIIDGSRNRRLVTVDCSAGIPVLEKPARVDASMGDVHPFGNPHYWLDPRNGGRIARTIAEAFSKADPTHAGDYRRRADAFAAQAETTWRRGREGIEKLSNRSLVTYHASWIYFADAFDFEILGTAEPVPGIPPTARHLADLIRIVKARRVPVFLQEPYFSNDAGRFLSRQTGIRVIKAAPSCDSPAAGSYLAHFETILRQIAAAAVQKAGAR